MDDSLESSSITEVALAMDAFDERAIGLNVAFQLSWMTLMHIINMTFTNGSMVDFGWPSGFSAMALWYLMNGPGVWIHRALLSSLYLICGARFMCGWVLRGHLTREDHRWAHWRTHWQSKGGFFGSTSVAFNFFCFYHCQSTTNIVFMSVPLHIAATNTATEVSLWEYIGLGTWLLGFVIENIADRQLDIWKRTNRDGGVLRSGLWKYSRHPNYFGEFLLWVAYALMAWPAATSGLQRVLLFLLPAVAYYYLVFFTGAWMAEQVSLKKRGAAYAQYQAETPLLFPWHPKPRRA
ncbi:hypothetical protein ACHHYP_09088 [Achlya hypogyna]|uniref:Uncharacterized protein n=1 Tax=Achlya hypogyna TaxID=1202772 RepID=A0A1V9YNR4_ACHHY|nr:hypothetical protein ACHHYP_09088 [Achlya hypogyna]